MATWKKFFRSTNTVLPKTTSTIGGLSSAAKFNTWLPEVYLGPPNRLQRYIQYEQMDLDHEVHWALNIISQFCVQPDEYSGALFNFNFHDDPTPTETKVLNKMLGQWSKLNDFDGRLFGIFRGILMYGDQFFIRDPETYKLFWIDPHTVEKIVVNESKGKDIETYYIKDLSFNFLELVGTNQTERTQIGYGNTTSVYPQAQLSSFNNKSTGYVSTGYGSGSAMSLEENVAPVSAKHVVHASLSRGMDSGWPFGISELEKIFKVYKQKELLEDAILIYRIHRAPERRIFYIDVGDMPPNKARTYLEQVKYEVQQKRMPTRGGGGESVQDSSYNPLSTLEDYYFATTESSRGSRVETLPGGENLGCFAMDTKVDLLDGRSLSIKEIENELSNNKQLWTYSCHPITGKIAPGKISWAGVTRKDSKVIKVKLDNGESFICTDDHKFPIKGKGFQKISDLEIGQSMMGHYTRNEYISKNSKNEYTEFYDHEEDKWKFTHRMVADFFKDTKLYQEMTFSNDFINENHDTRHHKDHNRFNNNPENIVWMNYKDHLLYHSHLGFSKEDQERGSKAALEKMLWLKENDVEKYKEIISRQVSSRQKTMDEKSKFEREQINQKISQGIEEYISELSDHDLKSRNENSKNNFIKGTEKVQNLLKNDQEFRQYFSDMTKEGIKRSKVSNPQKWVERSKKISESNLERWKLDDYYDKVFEAQKIKFNAEMYQIITECYNKGYKRQEELCEELSRNTYFMKIFSDLNKKSHTNSNLDTFKYNHLALFLKSINTTWNKFRASNESIVIDKETIFLSKIANKSKNQKEFVENIGFSRYKVDKILQRKNINDYGILVGYNELKNHRIVDIEYLNETMDVGTLSIDSDEEYHDYHTFALSVGIFTKNSIDDLKYFNNKMLRALSVPSSYLPSGPDDGTASVNDGKVGTSFIQEFTFSETCKRHQRQIARTFDREFKMYLKKSGISIDSSLFTLEFNEPQNFSKYRQVELDAARLNVYASIAEVPYISKQFAIKRYLGLTEAEIEENERLWREENGTNAAGDPDSDLRNVGISSGDIAGMGIPPEMEAELPEEGVEAEMPEGGEVGMGNEQPAV